MKSVCTVRHGLCLAAAVMVSLLAAAPVALACLWDRDTLAQEARGLPDVIEIIVGRFERQPPQYYRMRLANVTLDHAEDPGRLELYDDAAVACDRLGDSSAAIEWMEQKNAQMRLMDLTDDERAEHEYRSLANLGTFYAHRWFNDGADRGDMTDLRDAESHIARAIELNPDAHFGRERYQLAAIRAILYPYHQPGEASTRYPTLLDNRDRGISLDAIERGENALAELGYEDAITGLTGLIVLGNAWQSVDVFHTLSVVLHVDGKSHLALLAQLRAQELIDAGSYPVLPGLPRDIHRRAVVGPAYTAAIHAPEVFDYFTEARAAADTWHDNRIAYMTQRFADGQHPDTHPDFWAQWDDAPALPVAATIAGSGSRLVSWLLSVLVLVLIGGVAAIILKRSQAT